MYIDPMAGFHSLIGLGCGSDDLHAVAIRGKRLRELSRKDFRSPNRFRGIGGGVDRTDDQNAHGQVL